MKPTDITTPGAVVKNAVTKSGKKAVIRVLAPDDVDLLLTFANNLVAEDTYVMLSGKPLTRSYEKKYVSDALKSIKKKKKLHLLAFVGDKLAGSFEIRRFERRSFHVGEIGISLVPEFRGDGLGEIAMNTLTEAAKLMGLRLLTLTCFSVNRRAIALYEKVGFRKAGSIPGVYLYRGSYEDDCIMYKPLT